MNNGTKMNKTLAYEMGKDCALNGATTTNSHYSIFATPRLRDAWQKGYDEIKNE